MKYFLDTEFLEGPQKRFFGFSQTKPTIDLISIGIFAEDGRIYYAISKDFNLKEAWNRYDSKINRAYPNGPEYIREYWIRENVLKHIFNELCKKDSNKYISLDFTYMNLKFLLNKYGKSNEQIAQEIKLFTIYLIDFENECSGGIMSQIKQTEEGIEFYAYYADYDWVVFCWLFGRMIDLPTVFPKYCRDLKQMLDEKQKEVKYYGYKKDSGRIGSFLDLKKQKDYPVNPLEHNALADAEWNKRLYEFIQKIVIN